MLFVTFRLGDISDFIDGHSTSAIGKTQNVISIVEAKLLLLLNNRLVNLGPVLAAQHRGMYTYVFRYVFCNAILFRTKRLIADNHELSFLFFSQKYPLTLI